MKKLFFLFIFLITFLFSSKVYADDNLNLTYSESSFSELTGSSLVNALCNTDYMNSYTFSNKNEAISYVDGRIKALNHNGFYYILRYQGFLYCLYTSEEIADNSVISEYCTTNGLTMIAPYVFVSSNNRYNRPNYTTLILQNGTYIEYMLPLYSMLSSYLSSTSVSRFELSSYYNSCCNYNTNVDFLVYGGVPEVNNSINFEDSEFDDSLGKLNIKTSRYLNTSTHIYHDFFTIDTTTTTNVDVTQPGYGIKCQVLFYGDNDYLYDTEYFNLTDYRFNYDWKSKTFENLSLPSLPEPDKFSHYRIFLFPYKEENGTIKRGSFSSVSYGDYVSGVSTSNTREVGVHRVGVTRPDGSTKELDSFVKPLPVISGKGLTLSDKDTINNKYVYEYHYPDEPDEITNNYISNNITNPDSIVDIPGNENVSDFDFGSIKAFLTGLYNFLFKLSKVLILWLGLPPFLATVLNLGLYVIVFLIFGSLFKKLF